MPAPEFFGGHVDVARLDPSATMGRAPSWGAKELAMATTWLDGGAGRASAGLRRLIAAGTTTAVPGAHDGISALLARRAGFEALYLSGAALSASMALPDL